MKYKQILKTDTIAYIILTMVLMGIGNGRLR